MAEVPGLPPLDPAIVKATVSVCLDAINSAGVSSLKAKCREAGADVEHTAMVCEAATLKESNKALMVEPSPVLVDMMGLDPRVFPIGSFCTGLATWAHGFRTAFDILDKHIQANASSQHRRDSNDSVPKSQ